MSNQEFIQVEINGQCVFLKPGQKVMIGGRHLVFSGTYDNVDDVPRVPGLLWRHKGTNKVLETFRDYKTNILEKLVNGTSTAADDIDPYTMEDRLLKLETTPNDDELMVDIKIALSKKGVTVGQFKKAYGDDERTGCNNDRQKIERRNTVSFNKFRDIIGRFGYGYRLTVFDKETGKDIRDL